MKLRNKNAHNAKLKLARRNLAPDELKNNTRPFLSRFWLHRKAEKIYNSIMLRIKQKEHQARVIRAKIERAK